MPCYHPIHALQPWEGGKLTFPRPGTSYLYNDYRTLEIGCGQCIGCRLKRSRQWAVRCLHEKQLHRYNCYITLTYDAKHLADTSLHYEHWQAFMRRLRKLAQRQERRNSKAAFKRGGLQDARATQANSSHIGRYGAAPHAPGIIKDAGSIKFYMAGEYGETYGRPHWHALLFNLDFQDKLYFKRTPAGGKIYTSATLAKLWPYGFNSIGEVTFESAAYIARYVMKKRTGDGEIQEYKIIDPETGEINSKRKEFNQMSRRPGIGSSWLDKFASDVYTTGKVIIRGHAQHPPRYYDKRYQKLHPGGLEDFQHARYLEQIAQAEHHTPERLAVQEQVAQARTKTLQRSQPWEQT